MTEGQTAEALRLANEAIAASKTQKNPAAAFLKSFSSFRENLPVVSAADQKKLVRKLSAVVDAMVTTDFFHVLPRKVAGEDREEPEGDWESIRDIRSTIIDISHQLDSLRPGAITAKKRAEIQKEINLARIFMEYRATFYDVANNGRTENPCRTYLVVVGQSKGTPTVIPQMPR